MAKWKFWNHWKKLKWPIGKTLFPITDVKRHNDYQIGNCFFVFRKLLETMKADGVEVTESVYASIIMGKFLSGYVKLRLPQRFLALLVETSRAYAIPRCLSVRLSVCPSVRPSVCPSVRLSVRKQFLLSHLLWGYLSQRLLYSPSLLALWCSCAPAIVIMILSPGAQKGGVTIFPI